MADQSTQAAVQWLNERLSDAPELTPELFDELRARQREQGLLHGDRPICSYLRPFLLPRARYREITEAAETIAQAMERLVARALEDDAVMSELGLTEKEIAFAGIDPGYSPLCVNSRLDAFLTETDFKFLEYNAESPAGLTDGVLSENVFYDLPHMKEFLQRFPHWRPQPHRQILPALLGAYREWSSKRGETKERPNIAIIDWKGVATENEFHVLKRIFEAEGYQTVIADPHDLRYENGRLAVGDFEIDILYKRVIIHEFLAKFDETHPVARAYAEGKVCIANSFRTKVAHKKASFSVLSDERFSHLFTREQLDCISRCIPWTRNVRRRRTIFENAEHDLIDLIKRKREEMVLKPNDDYGGHGVVLGAEVTDAEWDAHIARALEESFVVQQRVAVRKELMPEFTDVLRWEELLVDFDPFLFLNKAHGGIVRLSSSSLCNVSSGGGVTALLILEDEATDAQPD
jgi:hypothetical protein